MGTYHTDPSAKPAPSHRESDASNEERDGFVGRFISVDCDPPGFVDTPTERNALTDGGESVESDSAHQTDLRDLFVDVTGTEELVETQTGERQTRRVASNEERSLAGDVIEVTREDGLDDTLPKPEGDQG